MVTEILISPYAEKVKLVKAMAAERYGQEVTERPTEPSDEMVWRFKCITDGHYVDDPLFWRLDTYHKGVNAHTVFQLYDEITEDLVKTRFWAMEISREEFYEFNQKLEKEWMNVRPEGPRKEPIDWESFMLFCVFGTVFLCFSVAIVYLIVFFIHAIAN
ncbi:MAG: hypothetical protein NWE89_00895 [Candidatus Bathyarchaeota archaeon]|nr:hypothetical protein [Candidatus Bathyarchaeota archaeon]